MPRNQKAQNEPTCATKNHTAPQSKSFVQNEAILFGTTFAQTARFRLALLWGVVMIALDEPGSGERDDRPAAGARGQVPREGLRASGQAARRRLRPRPG